MVIAILSAAGNSSRALGWTGAEPASHRSAGASASGAWLPGFPGSPDGSLLFV